MKLVLTITTFLLTLCSATGVAQQAASETWYVLVREGDVRVHPPSEIRFGNKLVPDSKITLGPGAYLSLFSESGRVVEFRKEQTIVPMDIKTGSSGLSGFSVESIKKNAFADIDGHSPTGAVCAGIPSADLLCDGGSFLEGDTVRVAWKHMPQDSLYTFFLQDIFYDKAIWSVQTTANEVVLTEIAKARLKESGEEQFFASLVSHSYHASTDIAVKLVSSKSPDAAWRREMEKTYSDKTAPECLIKGLLLMDRRFTFAAEGYLRRAMALRPEVTAFRKIYKTYKQQFEFDCK